MTTNLGQRELAERVCRELVEAVPGSDCRLRGSLSTGSADQWSDVDLRWQVADAAFEQAVEAARDHLARVAPLTSYRIDPDFARSDRRRLLYVGFAGVPLFWRLDLELVCDSIAGDDMYDRANPAARDASEWSPHESALLNGLAALKAIYRGDKQLAAELLARGAARAGVRPPEEASGAEIAAYAERIAAREAAVRGLADELIAAAHDLP